MYCVLRMHIPPLPLTVQRHCSNVMNPQFVPPPEYAHHG